MNFRLVRFAKRRYATSCRTTLHLTTVDPDLASVAAAVGAALLALLGARRRSGRPRADGPTAGQWVAELGADVSKAAASAGGGVGRLAASLAAGVIETAGVTAGATIRAASAITTTVSAGAVAIGGEVVARAGGLVLDGGLAIGDRFTKHSPEGH